MREQLALQGYGGVRVGVAPGAILVEAALPAVDASPPQRPNTVSTGLGTATEDDFDDDERRCPSAVRPRARAVCPREYFL